MAIVGSSKGKQDYYVVANDTERNALAPKKEGLLIYHQTDNKFYYLESDLVTWTELSTGGSGGSADQEDILNSIVTYIKDIDSEPYVVIQNNGNVVFGGI